MSSADEDFDYDAYEARIAARAAIEQRPPSYLDRMELARTDQTLERRLSDSEQALDFGESDEEWGLRRWY